MLDVEGLKELHRLGNEARVELEQSVVEELSEVLGEGLGLLEAGLQALGQRLDVRYPLPVVQLRRSKRSEAKRGEFLMDQGGGEESQRVENNVGWWRLVYISRLHQGSLARFARSPPGPTSGPGSRCPRGACI